MSVPYLIYSCSRCEWRADSVVTWGMMRYQGPHGSLPIERESGWCHACARVVPIEVLPSLARVREIEEREYPSMWADAEWTDPLSEAQLAKDEDHRLISRALDLAFERARLALLTDRQSPPRCLTCGSIEVFSVPDDPPPTTDDGDPGPPAALGVPHPGCGGDLLVCESQTRIALSIPLRFFETEGCEIKSEAPAVPRGAVQMDIFGEPDGSDGQ